MVKSSFVIHDLHMDFWSTFSEVTNWEVAIFYLVAFILFQVLSQCRFRKLWKITWRVYWSNISTPAKQTLSLLKKERWGTSPLYPGSWRTLLAPHAHRHLALPVMRKLGAAVRLGGPASESPAKCPCLGCERLERLKIGVEVGGHPLALPLGPIWPHQPWACFLLHRTPQLKPGAQGLLCDCWHNVILSQSKASYLAVCLLSDPCLAWTNDCTHHLERPFLQAGWSPPRLFDA